VSHVEKEAKRIKKGRKLKDSLGLVIEYPNGSMVGKCYEAFLFSFLQLKKFPPRANARDFFVFRFFRLLMNPQFEDEYGGDPDEPCWEITWLHSHELSVII
jgi:hypothetical protein